VQPGPSPPAWRVRSATAAPAPRPCRVGAFRCRSVSARGLGAVRSCGGLVRRGCNGGTPCQVARHDTGGSRVLAYGVSRIIREQLALLSFALFSCCKPREKFGSGNAKKTVNTSLRWSRFQRKHKCAYLDFSHAQKLVRVDALFTLIAVRNRLRMRGTHIYQIWGDVNMRDGENGGRMVVVARNATERGHSYIGAGDTQSTSLVQCTKCL